MTTLSKPIKKNSPLAQKAIDFYLSQAKTLIEKADQPSMASFRQCVADRFEEQGFPTRRDEHWKYTPLTEFLQTHYTIEGVASIDRAQVKSFLPDFEVMHLVFVDGHFSGKFSDDMSDLAAGLTVEAVKDTLDFTAGYQVLMAHEEGIEQEPFGRLNSMLFDDGVVIHVDPHYAVKRPILCTFIQTQDKHANTVRNRISLENGAQMTLIQQHVSLHENLNAFDNVVTEISLAEGAHLNQVVLQDITKQGMYFGLQFVEQSKKSNFRTHFIGLGGAISRHQNFVKMRDERIETEQSSACFANGTQIMDTRTHTEHQAWWGESRQLHSLVLDDQAGGVFDGMIKVHKNGQKTDGQMDNKNLLLSNKAQIDSKPRLEIYADDVKCSHGSASGQINEEQIFYLRSRGISEADARLLITQAFLLEPLETIVSVPLRNWLAAKLTHKLNS